MKNPSYALLAAAMFACGVSATEYYVAPDGTGDYLSPQTPGPSPVEAAKKATAAGDVIHLAVGTYETTEEVKVLRGVNLIGGSDNPEETVISRIVSVTNSSTNARVIFLGQNAVARNLTSRGGYTVYQGAGILGLEGGSVHKIFSVSNCVVENATASYKGGASFGGTWRNCVIRNSAVLRESSNFPEGSGGGIWGATLYDCIITNNSSPYLGGGIAGDATDQCVAHNCTIAFNRAPFGGGAGGSQTCAYIGCRLYGCTVVSNVSQNLSGRSWGGKGGGASNCYVTNSVITGNTAGFNYTDADSGAGGGVRNCQVYDSTIRANCTSLSSSGAGASGAYLEKCRIVDNWSIRYSGGSINSTNVNCLFTGNSATIGGAALGGELVGCIVSNNVARNQEAGACYNSTARNCLFAYNHTTLDSTCFRGYYEGCLFVSNTMAKTTGGGSAIGITASNPDHHAVAVNCTVVGNTGGICAFYNVYATNCIVYGNSPQDVRSSSLASNCLFGTADGTPDASCLVGVNPKFMNGGVTFYDVFALRSSSPCRDVGVYFPWMDSATDIAGNPRVKDGHVDMGALECYPVLGTYLLFR